MKIIWIYSLVSTLIISIVSLIGIITLGIKIEKLKKILIYFVSFSAGALMGDTFLHLIPEAIELGWTNLSGVYIVGGILFGLITEKLIHRNHCHMPITKTHVHPFAIMNLVGDFVHNIIDGIIIASSFIVSIPTGIATSLAVLFHEIPQEIGDFGVLIHGGFSRKKALLINFLTALSAFVGVILTLILSKYIPEITNILIPFAAGSFIYIAGSDLIPELHKENKTGQALLQISFFILGIAIMYSLLFLE